MGDKGTNVSIKRIMNEVKDVSGGDIIVTYGQVRRILKHCGFKWGTGGKKNHILKEADHNLCARYWHVAQKIANRGANGMPILPEIYLDESYCHHHHTKYSTWWCAHRARSTRGGKGARWNIIGSIVYLNKLCNVWGFWRFKCVQVRKLACEWLHGRTAATGQNSSGEAPRIWKGGKKDKYVELADYHGYDCLHNREYFLSYKWC